MPEFFVARRYPTRPLAALVKRGNAWREARLPIWLPQLLAARAGQTAAYDRIVRTFQDMAFAVALSHVPERAAAEEITQDAFIEAFMALESLNDPLAFPGWLRTIVERQCSRWLRARKPHPAPPHDDGSDPSLEREVEARELQVQLVSVLDELPEHKRAVVLMVYVADYSQREIAELLELPLTTVKKRLHDAKACVRRLLLATAESSVHALRPSSRRRFGDSVAFSTACISGDVATVEALLRQSPALVRCFGAVEEPHMRRIDAHWGWPPLHLAAHHGHRRLVQLLLEHGAPLEARALNSIGNTALGAAVWGDHLEIVRLLVVAGADIDAVNHFGQSPLHRAVRRGALEIAALLRRSGADASLCDADGLTFWRNGPEL